ncbi:MAG TPA: GrpB family protein [Acetobacteraceae bacterium]|nr:GrpB family protein [Acetobacteraceae bacterium]
MDDVELVAYDPDWPRLFDVEAERLRAVLDPALLLGIEHFGSTAVPGMIAKPVIDILVAVHSLAQAKAEAVAPIRSLGYAYWEDNPKPDRMFFVKGMPPYGARRTHHVHITEPGSEMWQRRLAFRDYLRVNPQEAERYAALKRDLARRYPSDREGYTGAKTDYVAAVHRRIGLWPD